MGKTKKHHPYNANKAIRNLMSYTQGDKIIADLMASFAVVLFNDTNMDSDDITSLLGRVQEEWDRHSYYGYDMVTYCDQLTGINVIGDRSQVKNQYREAEQ